MSDKTLTRSDICEALSNKIGLPKQRANDILENVLEEMIRGLVKQGTLKLSSFGSFNVRKKSTRVGRNPKTGKEVMITPRQTVSFRASHILKNRVYKNGRG